MTKEERREDIHNRFTLAMAERDAFVEKGSENYETLSTIMKDILDEYKTGKHLRHGFRLYGTQYSAVTLQDSEAI